MRNAEAFVHAITLRDVRRRPLLAIKRCLDALRRWVDVYGWLTALSPWPLGMLRLLGGVAQKTARCVGRLRVWEPAWVQLNRDAEAKDLSLGAGVFCLVDHGASLGPGRWETPVLATKTTRRLGRDVTPSRVTLSFDLEGAVGLAHLSGRAYAENRHRWDPRPALDCILPLLETHKIPSTWAICGHLFLDGCDGGHDVNETLAGRAWFAEDPAAASGSGGGWYMPDVVRILRDHPLCEVAYHSFGHYRYLHHAPETIAADMAWAKRLREEWSLPLRTLVFPFNETGYIDEVVAAGFRAVRGYVGRHACRRTVDFGDLVFYVTSQHLSPRNAATEADALAGAAGNHYNVFTHPEEWIGESVEPLGRWLAYAATLRAAGAIRIGFMDPENAWLS